MPGHYGLPDCVSTPKNASERVRVAQSAVAGPYSLSTQRTESLGGCRRLAPHRHRCSRPADHGHTSRKAGLEIPDESVQKSVYVCCAGGRPRLVKCTDRPAFDGRRVEADLLAADLREGAVYPHVCQKQSPSDPAA